MLIAILVVLAISLLIYKTLTEIAKIDFDKINYCKDEEKAHCTYEDYKECYR